MSVVDMNGGAGAGGGAPPEGGGGGADSLSDVFGYLRAVGPNGIAINGILVWIDIQQKSTPENVWMAQAESHFADLEIDLARSSLWKAAIDKKAIIGNMIVHKTPGKVRKNLVDIAKAMMILKEKSMLPLLLTTSNMMKKCPAFHSDKGNTDAIDVMAKVKVLEESMDNFMKQQGEQMRNLTETMVKVCQERPPPAPPAMDNRVRDLRKNDNVSRSRSASPNKRARVEDQEEEEPFENVEVRKENAPSYASAASSGQGQQRQRQEQQRQQQQRQHLDQPQGPPRFRKRSTLVFGEAKTGKNDTEELLAADANLVASGVSKDATCQQFKDFIASKGIDVTDIELISNAPERRTNTFRVSIKASDYEKAMKPEVWPYRVGVRRFIPKRPKGDWASQSSQSGGNVRVDYGRDRQGNGDHAGGARQHRGGYNQPRHDTRGGQYAQSAPHIEEFHVDTQNRFNGLQDNESN